MSRKQSSESKRGLIPCQAKSQRLARPQVAFAPRFCGAAFFKLSCRHHSSGKCNFRRRVSFWCIARQACGLAEHVFLPARTQTTHTRAPLNQRNETRWLKAGFSHTQQQKMIFSCVSQSGDGALLFCTPAGRIGGAAAAFRDGASPPIHFRYTPCHTCQTRFFALCSRPETTLSWKSFPGARNAWMNCSAALVNGGFGSSLYFTPFLIIKK